MEYRQEYIDAVIIRIMSKYNLSYLEAKKRFDEETKANIEPDYDIQMDALYDSLYPEEETMTLADTLLEEQEGYDVY